MRWGILDDDGGYFYCITYTFTNWARETLMEAFTACEMELVTAGQPECIDHIALSRSFPREGMATVREWNLEKTLSDHKGIYIDF